jgi:probable HAF family extracellular repeat protein
MAGRPFAAALFLAALLLPSAQASADRTARYSVRDLGTLRGTVTSATDVNALGQVVGSSETATGRTHAFFWDRGRMTDLGTLGGTESHAAAVNDAGWVVGYSQPAGSTSSHAFLWRKGRGMRDLGTLGGAQSFAADVNDLGLVVGRSFDSTGTPRGFAWTSSAGMRALAGDPFSVAAAAGAGLDGPIGGSAGFPLVPGDWGGAANPFTPFPLPVGFDQGQTRGLDVRGDAVGTLGTDSGLVRAFYRPVRGAARALAAPAPFANSEAYAVSNSLRIVGSAYNDPLQGTQGWLAQTPASAPRLLSELAGGSGWVFSVPASVNDLGQIVGTGIIGGRARGFLLTPTAQQRVASLGAFVPGGRSFHQRIRRTLKRALSDSAHGRKKRACASLLRLASGARHEKTLAAPVRPVFAADIRGFRRGLAC